MAFTTMTAGDLLREFEMEAEAEAVAAQNPPTQYAQYWVSGEKHLHVACTATQFMARLTRYSVRSQGKFLARLSEKVPNPGDIFNIKSAGEGKEKQPAVLVMRQSGPDNEIRLVISC